MNWRACSKSGGTAAASAAAMTPNDATSTTVTAAHRGNLRLISHDTAGSSPSETKNATPISSSIDDTRTRPRTTAKVTATPAAALIPTKNGDRLSSGGPGGPRGCSSELSFQATRSASAIGPSPSSSVLRSVSATGRVSVSSRQKLFAGDYPVSAAFNLRVSQPRDPRPLGVAGTGLSQQAPAAPVVGVRNTAQHNEVPAAEGLDIVGQGLVDQPRLKGLDCRCTSCWWATKSLGNNLIGTSRAGARLARPKRSAESVDPTDAVTVRPSAANPDSHNLHSNRMGPDYSGIQFPKNQNPHPFWSGLQAGWAHGAHGGGGGGGGAHGGGGGGGTGPTSGADHRGHIEHRARQPGRPARRAAAVQRRTGRPGAGSQARRIKRTVCDVVRPAPRQCVTPRRERPDQSQRALRGWGVGQTLSAWLPGEISLTPEQLVGQLAALLNETGPDVRRPRHTSRR